MSNPVDWFEIYVQDMSRAKAFYEGVFGVRLNKLGADLEMWAFPMGQEGYGVTGALVHVPGFAPGGNSILVYFRCEDCALEAEKAVQLGGRMKRPKMSIGQYGFVALVHDTEGNLIGLHSMR